MKSFESYSYILLVMGGPLKITLFFFNTLSHDLLSAMEFNCLDSYSYCDCDWRQADPLGQLTSHLVFLVAFEITVTVLV